MFLENKKLVISYIMNQIFLGQPVDAIKTWFTTEFPTWPTYTTLKFVDGTTQTKEINGAAIWQNIGVKSSMFNIDNTLTYCQLGKNVTEICSWTFFTYRSLTSIDIPNSVSSIGEYVFAQCRSLTSIDIPNSVTSIRRQVFERCSSLTSISIPSSVTSIGYSAFNGCTSLSSVSIPSSITLIEIDAFNDCSSLTSVIFEGRTSSEITAMANYPWKIPNTSALKPGIS